MITVNGEAVELPAEPVIAQVVARLAGSRGRGIAVALNGEVVPRTAWDSTVVTSGDKVEVLSANPGG